MKILVVDRDELAASMIKSRLEPIGHQIVCQAGRTEGLDELAQQDFDLVFIDPSPQLHVKSLVLSIRKQIRYYPYLVVMSDHLTVTEALSSGCNDLLPKPLNPAQLDLITDNARRLSATLKLLNDSKEDFPSAGGIIAKSAINQLVLSCIDRADRYGEKTYMLMIELLNYKEIVANRGVSEADFSAARLAQYLVKLRRASDIIGQIRGASYTLLLLRPSTANEPLEAASRFAESLSRANDLTSGSGLKLELSVELVELPTGAQLVQHQFTLNG
jgi:DNA-binding response OmpR family regulator